MRRDERQEHRWTPVRTLVIAAVVLLALDLLPITWVGTGLYVGVLVVGGCWVAWASQSRSWGLAHVTALGVAAVVERTLVGFLAPLPPGVAMAEKVLQSVVLLGLVAAASIAAWRRATPDDSRPRSSGALR